MNYTLLILAGGLGSRFQGNKQLSGLGPHDELLMEYAIWDAVKAGFNKIVILTNHDCIPVLKEKLAYLDSKVQLHYVNQFEHDPAYPNHRKKPWGTAHAVLACESLINEPFMVINADDFYGPDVYTKLKPFSESSSMQNIYGLVVFQLGNTLSSEGGVSRGICTVENGELISISEHTNVMKSGGGAVSEQSTDSMSLNEMVSMNCWMFTPSFFKILKDSFDAFYHINRSSETMEIYLPDVIDHYLVSKQISVRILQTDCTWFGMTFPKDRDNCQKEINALIEKGWYPKKLNLLYE